jgi:uncharacterized protein
MPTALFGSSAQLAALLDAGLNVNSKTEGGTALLTMAAADEDKVRLLLSRGADAGGGALTAAAAYRGTAGAIQALLDAGAKMTGAALVLSSMTGDLDNVRLLLARGADPNAAWRGNPPISQAVTFGYPDIVQALIAAGASVSMRESSGINLLHWAAIANRPSVIPALAVAGVPVNDRDQFGFTPLMYAATIDFGDLDAVKTLLRAGADPGIRNNEGRTAREQARHFGHSRIEAALR